MNSATPKRCITLPMMVLRGLVVFPEMVLHFDAGRKKSIEALSAAMSANQTIFLAAQKDLETEDPDNQDIYSIGVVAKVKQILKLRDKGMRVLIEGLYRARTISIRDKDGYMEAIVEEYPLEACEAENSMMAVALMRSAKELFQEYIAYAPKMPKELIMNILTEEEPSVFVHLIAGHILHEVREKQEILEESSLTHRLEVLVRFLQEETQILQLEQEIADRVKEQMDANQRDYYLREQLRAISAELGEGENAADEVEEYRAKILELDIDDDSKEKLMEEAERLYKMPLNSQEAGVIRTYLDTCLSLPFGKFSKDKLDVDKAKKTLDKDHYGLQKVKERILEMIAVRKLAPDLKGQILCLVGPPGVGKTSIARSIAKVLGRNYVRVSLGGVRDESDIRGHRKTYVGSMPGRIINAYIQAKTQNPLILLDEIDKMGNDFRGDPSSAMLEVLDSEQNVAFRDHYIEVPFDLSRTLFLTTANDLYSIPDPLRDRMEIIELSSYTREEKFQIGKKYLVPKQLAKNGLTAKQLRISNSAIYELIDSYTREAGVRTLEREIGKLCRKAATSVIKAPEKRITITAKNMEGYMGIKRFKPEHLREKNEIGVVTGLAWTSVGGETMEIEVAVMEGNGKVELTGSLGDVMKESAHAAITCIRTHASQWNIPDDFYKTKDIHIHAPEGAVPKDGPSAGVTMTTAIVSALTGIPVRRDIAMTGEITLRGRVLPIGGLREKTMAAYKTGIKTVLIPAENEPDLEEVEPIVKEHVRFICASTIDTVLENALCVDVTSQIQYEKNDPGKEAAGEKYPPMPIQPQPAVTTVQARGETR